MAEKDLAKSVEHLDGVIREIRGQKVILDADLARVYGVTTKALNQAVKRNRKKFPADFMFRLTGNECESLMLQIATSNDRSQIAIGSQKHREKCVLTRYRPKRPCRPTIRVARRGSVPLRVVTCR